MPGFRFGPAINTVLEGEDKTGSTTFYNLKCIWLVNQCIKFWKLNEHMT